MIFIKPPETDYSDYYDKSRYNMMWNFCISIMLLLLVVTISNNSNSNYSAIPNLIAIAISGIAMYLMLLTKKYELVSKLASISIFILISITFFALKNVIHYTTPLWMILNIQFTFFMLGKKWGIFILTAHFIVVFFYFYFRLEENVFNLQPFDIMDRFNFIIESSIVAAGIGYLLVQFLNANKYAESMLKKNNDELTSQNLIITAQNEEKEIMLKEIHHRVKNNLQVITSLLRLQSRDIPDTSQGEAFSTAIARVKSIALIHEKLYESDMLTSFDLKNYFDSLAKNISSEYPFTVQIETTTEIDGVKTESIVPLALLYNELVTNSFKHAFQDTKQPKIKVHLSMLNNHLFQLVYSDNGTWKDNSSKAFGTEIIDAMTEQMDGQYTLEKTKVGTCYQFTLRNIWLG